MALTMILVKCLMLITLAHICICQTSCSGYYDGTGDWNSCVHPTSSCCGDSFSLHCCQGDDDINTDDASTTASTGVIVGAIIGSLILLAAIIGGIVACVCCCTAASGSARTVGRTNQTYVATTTVTQPGYQPMQTHAGYDQPAPGYGYPAGQAAQYPPQGAAPAYPPSYNQNA